MEKILFDELHISYQDLKENKDIEGDKYEIAKDCLCEGRLKMLFSNPNLKDMTKDAMFLKKANGVVVGEGMNFPTKFKAGDIIENSTGGTTLYVHPNYRKYNVGADIILNPMTNHQNEFLIYADLSEVALRSYKVLRFSDFSLKKYLQPRKAQVVLELKGIKGFFLKFLAPVLNVGLRFQRFLCYYFKNHNRNIVVKQVTKVPEWIDDIVLNDGHKYMEVHDHRWMQWCLDNMFSQHPEHKNSFFIIEKDGEPYGFFLTKIRIHTLKEYNITPKKFCSIMEWGSKDESVLGEADIYDLAMVTIDKDVDIVQLATNNIEAQKRLKKQLFIQRGEHHVVFKDIYKKYKDAKDQNLWRIRYGYSDSIFN